MYVCRPWAVISKFDSAPTFLYAYERCWPTDFLMRDYAGWNESYDVVTYWYGPRYNEDYSLRKDGLFVEFHDFTQTMTPLTADSSGFVLLGRPVDPADVTATPCPSAAEEGGAGGCSCFGCCSGGVSMNWMFSWLCLYVLCVHSWITLWRRLL